MYPLSVSGVAVFLLIVDWLRCPLKRELTDEGFMLKHIVSPLVTLAKLMKTGGDIFIIIYWNVAFQPKCLLGETNTLLITFPKQFIPNDPYFLYPLLCLLYLLMFHVVKKVVLKQLH